MAIVVLDTDVASRLHRRNVPPEIARVLVGATIVTTFVTVAELLQWPELRSWGEPRRRRLDAWLAGIPVLPYDAEVARSWARLSARAQLRGRPRPINDTWVAACCWATKLPLVTLNRRDFEDFEQHEGLELLPSLTSARADKQ